jgi:hypothetical protein
MTAALAGAGCSPDSATANKANVYLIVTEVETQAGGGETGAFLMSDVSIPVFNDNATVKLRNSAKNPLVSNDGHYQDVALERYTVRYYRTDGRNTEGVDVPYAFQGPLAGTVEAEGETDAVFVLVRQQAKLEPPLSQLSKDGGGILITCFAEVNIFGHTLTGEVVSARATVSVTFADFPDN